MSLFFCSFLNIAYICSVNKKISTILDCDLLSQLVSEPITSTIGSFFDNSTFLFIILIPLLAKVVES